MNLLEPIYIYLKKINEMLSKNPLFHHLNDGVIADDSFYRIIQKDIKVEIDLKWVEIIEEIIPNLNYLICNPKKFIKEETEVVDISLVKKISGESIKHLARNSNLIYSAIDDEIIPSKILNVIKEESCDIYENRFLYTLIKKLYEFVEIRYRVIKENLEKMPGSEVIFESKYFANENQYIFKMDTLTSKNFKECKHFNFADFKRVERLYSIICAFINSDFFKEMNGTSLIKGMVSYTNILKSDVNFRESLRLWEFLSTYNRRGFNILYINESSPRLIKVSDEFNGILFLNHLIVESLYSNNFLEVELEKTFENFNNISFNCKKLEAFICVVPLEIFLFEVKKELLEIEMDLINKHKAQLCLLNSRQSKETIYIFDGISITNKYNEFDFKYMKKLTELILDLKPDDYNGYTLNIVKEHYYKEIRELLEESHKKIIESMMFDYD